MIAVLEYQIRSLASGAASAYKKKRVMLYV